VLHLPLDNETEIIFLACDPVVDHRPNFDATKEMAAKAAAKSQTTPLPGCWEIDLKGPPGGRPSYPFLQSTDATNKSLAQYLVPGNGFPSLILVSSRPDESGAMRL
jgi:hypothetical protein